LDAAGCTATSSLGKITFMLPSVLPHRSSTDLLLSCVKKVETTEMSSCCPVTGHSTHCFHPWRAVMHITNATAAPIYPLPRRLEYQQDSESGYPPCEAGHSEGFELDSCRGSVSPCPPCRFSVFTCCVVLIRGFLHILTNGFPGLLTKFP